MIRKAIDILTVRWPEVMLVVVLSAAFMLFYGEISRSGQAAIEVDAELPFLPNFLLGLGTMTLFMVCLMLWLGFLKTSVTDGQQPQQPINLLIRGQRYFWKTALFLIAYQFFCALIVSFTVVFVWMIWKLDTTAPIEKQIEGISQFVQTSRVTELLMLPAYLVFIKPLLFIPARVLVFEEALPAAFAARRRYRLREIPNIFRLATGGIAVVAILTALSLLAEEQSIVYYIFTAAYHLLFCMLMLFLMLLAVLWMQGYLTGEQAQLQQENA